MRRGLDFLGLEDTFSEKDLEAGLVRQMEKFLIELGTGFYFGGRQRRISSGGKGFYIDLVFWHRALRCQVLIDLKTGALSPADIAQMRLYLTWVRGTIWPRARTSRSASSSAAARTSKSSSCCWPTARARRISASGWRSTSSSTARMRSRSTWRGSPGSAIDAPGGIDGVERKTLCSGRRRRRTARSGALISGTAGGRPCSWSG